MANYIRRLPGDQDLVQRLIQLKNQAQITGQVNPDMAPVVAASLADQREGNYKDAMLGLQERGQAANESQFAQSLAFQKQNMADQIAAANRARDLSWLQTGAGAGLVGAYLLNRKKVE